MGGFAYAQDAGTVVHLKDDITLSQQRAYFGGAFYLDEAELLLSNATIEQGEVYEGMISLNNFASANISHVVITRNTAYL